MKIKLSGEQKRQIKELKKKIRQELKRTPRGQGDGINQHLTVNALNREITQVKQDSTYSSPNVW
jgi:hypothetical protein